MGASGITSASCVWLLVRHEEMAKRMAKDNRWTIKVDDNECFAFIVCGYL